MILNKKLALNCFFIVGFILSGMAANATTNSKTIPKLDIAHFTKLPFTHQVEISPDGEHLAFIFNQDDRNENLLGIMRLSDMKIITTIAAAGAQKQIGRLYWANNTRVLYNILFNVNWDKTQALTGDLYGVNIDGSKHKPILGLYTDRSSNRIGKFGDHEIIDLLPEDQQHILVAFYPWRDGGRYYYLSEKALPHILKLNIYNARFDKITKLATPLADTIIDHNQQIRLSFITNGDNQTQFHYRKNNDEKWQSFDFIGLPQMKRINPISFTADNKKLYVLVDEAKGPNNLYLYHLDTHRADKIYQHSTADIDKFILDRNNEKIVSVMMNSNYPEYSILEQKSHIAQLLKKLLAKVPGFNIDIVSMNTTKDKAIVAVYSDYQPRLYYLYNEKEDDFKFLMAERSWINSKQMAFKEALTFKARDGLTLHGFLTRPQRKTKQLPTVILPHGGPHGVNDTWDFDWEAQLLANRGYAVLQLNFRGSGGYGYEFEQAGYRQWDGKMQNDITDATKQLIKNGIADKNKICIFGSSYGGYAALMGVIREPDLYRCAIGTMGVYSLPLLYSSGDISSRASGLSFLKQVLGDDQQRLKAFSPVYNADKIKSPLLLIHGAQDNRATIKHFEQLAQQLKANNKRYETLLLDNEGHGYYDEDNRKKVYSKIIEFLDKHIGP